MLTGVLKIISSQPGGRRGAVTDQPCSLEMEGGTRGGETQGGALDFPLLIRTRMEALVAILLVGGWGQVRERPPKTCAVLVTDLGLFILFYLFVWSKSPVF